MTTIPPPPTKQQRKTCGTCQEEVPAKAERCPWCRSRFVPGTEATTTDMIRGVIFLAMIIVFVVGMIWSAIF